jgi:hypothetical protein
MGDFSPYADNCFTIFRKDAMNPLAMMAASFMNQGTDAFILRDGLKVTYNCHHDENTTYCQYVVVTTNSAVYTIQFFYSDPKQSEKERIKSIEAVLSTICLASEVSSKQAQEDAVESLMDSLADIQSSLENILGTLEEAEAEAKLRPDIECRRPKYKIPENEKYYVSLDECEMDGTTLIKFDVEVDKPYLVLPKGIEAVGYSAIKKSKNI